MAKECKETFNGYFGKKYDNKNVKRLNCAEKSALSEHADDWNVEIKPTDTVGNVLAKISKNRMNFTK